MTTARKQPRRYGTTPPAPATTQATPTTRKRKPKEASK